ncbi:MAG: glycosyltransferase family 2 protein [Paracoccaceae bacterium]
MSGPHGVSCIIPAYNEGARIAGVLSCVVDHPAIAEVIVVDDGSSDDTAAVAAGFSGVNLIRQPSNGGKTAALATGLRWSTGPLILLLDADLSGLRPSDIDALLDPVLNGSAEMSISLRSNAPLVWRLIGLDYISGERAMRKDLLAGHLDRLSGLPRFGFEVFLNAIMVRGDLPLAVVAWPGVRNQLKNRKYGIWRGIQGDLNMIADLFRSFGPHDLLRQIIRMRRLRVTCP